MAVVPHSPRPVESAFSVVLYGDEARAVSASDLRAALGWQVRECDVIVLRPPGECPAARADGPTAYAQALRQAAVSRHPLVAVTDGAIDWAAFAYALPAARQFPVVWAYRRGEGRQRWDFLGWVYRALARLLLGTHVRDCDGGAHLAVFQREALAQLMPADADDPVPAEILARARRHGLAVTEVPVAGPPLVAVPGWRTQLGRCASLVRFWWSAVQFPGQAPAAGNRRWRSLGFLVVALAAFLLFTGLGGPLLDPDEGRQAEVPREMAARDDLLTPRMLGEPYYEKPPLQYWLTAAVYSRFGSRPWVARLVPAGAAWLTVLLTWAWGRRALGGRAAALGAAVLALSPGFVWLGHRVVLDSLLAGCVAASWYAGHTAVCRPTLRWRWWLVSALACGLGVLTKGPVALVLLAPPVWLYQALTAPAARPRWSAWAVYVGGVLGVAVPWYAAMALREPGYLTHFLWKDNVLRYLAPFDHEHAWWFYAPVLLVFTLPWSLAWPWLGRFLAVRDPRLASLRPSALGFCVLCAGWCLIFFSLAGCKSPPYLAPALAPLGLLVGAWLDAVLFRQAGQKDPFLERARSGLPWAAALVVLILSTACYLAGGVLGWRAWGPAGAGAALTLGAAAAWWRYGRRTSPAQRWAACAMATAAFVTVATRGLVDGYAARHTVEGIAHAARHWPGTQGYPVVSYLRQWPSASFYLRREQVGFFDEGELHGLVEYLGRQPGALVLVERGPPLEELLSALPRVLEATVRLPEREGQAALVVVRPRR
jgi:4-amino-4-deoxy-L-arabinose transferase-like glycosyltransferase